MIVEISDKGFDKPLIRNEQSDHPSLFHLNEIFNKLALPRPDISEVQRTHEKGFNLFLNHYGCVLRMYPWQKGERKTAFSSMQYGHVYHHKSLPPLGVVHLPQFKIQIMPGVVPYDRKRHKYADLIQQEYIRTIGSNHDSGERNLGFRSNKHTDANDLMLLDTVFPIFNNSTQHNEYLGTNVEQIQQRSAFVSDLQESFYKAWTSDRPFYMQNFWFKCRMAHLSGDRLCTGWLDEGNATLNMTNRGKGDFVQKSLDYDSRLQKILGR
mgnify:CR=1 FL=1|tara:strand:+ start:998 stop:1798 length:801 start_codon:yes stop_codon:yes gene_type:complete